MMKWIYNIRIHHKLTENWMHSVAQLRSKCLFATSERESSLADAMEGLRIEVGNKEFSL
jgi:hypothetical protein